MVEKLEKSIPWIIIITICIMVVFGSEVVLKEVAADTETSTTTIEVNNNTPSVGTVILHSDSDITLVENTTTTVSATATVTDVDGYSDISSVTGKLYRSGVGSSCSPDDDNNCYSDATCATSSPSGSSYTATCNYEVWFHADPTDAGIWESEYWDAWIKAIDTDNASSSATTTGNVEMNTLRALSLSADTISYGTLGKGEDTGTLNQNQTTTATGNEAIDIYLYGTRMEKSPWEDLDYTVSTSSSAFEFDPGNGGGPDIFQIDSTHYLVAYSGPDYDGWSTVLEIDESWNISTSSAAFEFDPADGTYPAISQIDSSHYLVAYHGPDDNGWSTVLEVDGSWNISTSSAAFEFGEGRYIGTHPAISQIDSTHYLVAYHGSDDNGWSTVLEVDGSWNISTSSAAFEFGEGINTGTFPAISQIDSTHYLVAYSGPDYDGWSTVLEIDESWNISTSSAAFEFDPGTSYSSVISQIDSTHYLVAYSNGWSTVLEIDESWNISTSSAAFEFDPGNGGGPDIFQIDSTHYLVAYSGPDYDGWSMVLNINTSTWAISKPGSAFEFDSDRGIRPAISQVDSTHYFVVYAGPDYDGWSTVLNPTLPNVIPVEYQEYATSSVSYTSGADLTTSVTTAVELDLSKPTSNPSTSTDEVYWGLMIPSYVQKGSYYGTATYEAKAD